MKLKGKLLLSEYCRVRQDLLDESLKVPIGDHYYGGKAILESRWLYADEPNEQFQVKFKGVWQDAQSIDFDFF